MLLTFSKDQFVERITSGSKIHTIRLDKHNRWEVGRKIHYWKGNPRNVKSTPYQFGEGIVSKIEEITIDPVLNRVYISDGEEVQELYTEMALHQFAVNDGFDSWEQMKEWFTEPFTGRLISWTDYKNVKHSTKKKGSPVI